MPSPDTKQLKGITEVAEGFRATRDFTFLPDQKTDWNKAGLEKFRARHTQERAADDKKQLSRLFNLAAKSPELKDALDWADTHGIDIIVDRTSVGVGGYYWVGSGVVAIGISSFNADSRLAGVAAHEIRHAWQDFYGIIATAETKHADYAVKNALIEADATAHQMLAEAQIGRVQAREAAAKFVSMSPETAAHYAKRDAREDSRLADTEKFLWAEFKGWYSSWKAKSYGDTAAKNFGKKLGIPGVEPPDWKLEFKPDSVPERLGIDFTREEQLRRLGKGFRGKNYFNAANDDKKGRDQLTRKLLSPSFAATFFNSVAKKPTKLVTEIRRRQLLLKQHKGRPVLVSLAT